MVLATGLELAFLWVVWEIGWEPLRVLLWELEMESLWGFAMGLPSVLLLEILMVSVMGPGREIELGFLRVFAWGLATEFV